MATLAILVDAKVAGLPEVATLDASVQKLGASTTKLGADLDKTTGQLNVSGAAHAATAKEAQALGADLEKTAGQTSLAATAHEKATASAQGLGVQLGSVGQQAQAAGQEAENLGAKLSSLEGGAGLGGVASAASEANTALQGLAAVNVEAAAATSSSSSAIQESSTAIASLAAVDATLGTQKKATSKTVAEEAVELEKAKVAHEEHAEAVLEGVKATGEFGAAGVEASEKLGTLSGILGGAGGISAGLAAFVVGAGAALAIVKDSVEHYDQLAESVEKYQRATGASAEESSRMVSTFERLGVDGGAAGDAMFNLAKRIEGVDGAAAAGGKTLASVGVEIAKNADGSTNLDKTLGSVADAYNAASSATEKDAIATAAFGKSGKDLIPILEQGSAGLQSMSESAEHIFTQEEIERVHRLHVEMTALEQENNRLKDAVGGAIVSVWEPMARSFSDAITVQDHLNGVQAQGRGQAYANAAAARQQIDANQKAAEAAKDEAASQQQLNNQLEAQEKDRKELLDVDNQSLHASLDLQRANQGVLSAQKALGQETLADAEYADKHRASVDQIAAAQAKLTAAIKSHGPVSAEAKAAQDALNAAVDKGKQLDLTNAEAADRLQGANLDLKNAMLSDAEAAVKFAEEQSKLAGGTLSAQDAAAAEAAELEKLKAAAGGTLPAELQALLDKLNSFHDVSATVHLRLDDQTGGMRGSGGTQIPAFDAGGMVPGPIGAPRLAVVHGGERVLTPAQQQESGRPGPIYNITQYITGVNDPVMAGDAAAARFSALLTST